MTDLLGFFTLLGMATTGVIVCELLTICWNVWGKKLFCVFHIHKHSYKVHRIWRVSDKERGCENWELICKCEKCDKSKMITFWNDGIKLKVAEEDEDNE